MCAHYLHLVYTEGRGMKLDRDTQRRPVLRRLARLLHEGRQVQAVGHGEGDESGVFGACEPRCHLTPLSLSLRVSPSVGVVESEALQVDAHDLRQLLRLTRCRR